MSIVPAKQRLTIWKGSTFAKQIGYSAVNSTDPEDLTDYTAEAIFRDRPGGTPILTLDTTNGGISLGGPTGTINLFMTDEDTAAITWQSAAYALYLIDPVGNSNIILYGAVRIRTV